MANITCIVCPMGCPLVVTKTDEELTNPKRVITSTVKLEKSYLNLLPVKTQDSIPKDMMFEIMEVLDNIKVSAPINVGDVIIENILNTGVNIVSAKTVEEVSA